VFITGFDCILHNTAVNMKNEIYSLHVMRTESETFCTTHLVSIKSEIFCTTLLVSIKSEILCPSHVMSIKIEIPIFMW
jgi:hypothetical protein